jgi:hypothetical protein
MPYVTAGNPDASFLQKKIDGTHCELAAQCRGGTCGDSMPQGGDLLGEESRLTIRRWIAQGAQNN